MDHKTKKNTVIGIVVICMIAFFPVLSADFINYDDPEYVLNNPYIKSFSLENIKQIFLGRTTDLYVPLTIFSYLIEYSIFGANAKGFHFINLLLHIINALLLLNILLKLNIKNNHLIYFILLFFAINPLVTESVCWITERKDVLYCLFYFLAIIQFLNFTHTKNKKHILYCFVFFILSCISKPMAVSLPVLFSLYIIYINSKEKLFLIEWKKHIFLLPFYAVSVLSSVVSIYSLKKLGPIKVNLTSYTLPEKIVLLFSETGYYFFKPFMPVNQQLFHLFPEKENLFSTTGLLIFACLGLCIIGFIIYQFFKKKNKPVGFLFLAWFIFLLPILQIYSNTHSYVSERYFYVSIIFPVAILFLFLQSFIKKQTLNYVAITLVLSFTILTFKRSAVWKNSETLFTTELKVNPDNPFALNNLAVHYNSNSEFLKASLLLKPVVKSDSTNATYLNNYGLSLSALGQFDEAIYYLQKAIAINPEYTEALSNIGICYIKIRQPEKSFPYFKKAYEINPNNADVLFNLGLHYYNFNQKTEALPLLKKASLLGNKKAMKYLLKM